MKRIMSVLLAVAMLFALTACGSQSESPTNSNGPSASSGSSGENSGVPEKTVITVWAQGGQEEAPLTERFAEIEQELGNVIIAYEPVWAIGTGRTATSEQADEVCGIIRGVVASLYSSAAAEAMTIQYGGSMNAKNAAELLAMPNVDGGLIGGASLKAPDFAVIINAAQK